MLLSAVGAVPAVTAVPWGLQKCCFHPFTWLAVRLSVTLRLWDSPARFSCRRQERHART